MAPRCPRLRALTYEGDGHPDALARATLARLRRLLPRPAARVPRPAPAVPPAPPRADAPDAKAAWREDHAGRLENDASPVDPARLTVELQRAIPDDGEAPRDRGGLRRASARSSRASSVVQGPHAGGSADDPNTCPAKA